MPTVWYEGEIIAIQELSPDTRQFFVQVRDLENFDFLPGQFVTMDLPVGEKRLNRWKSYSIASSPDGSNIIEFCIVRLGGGAGTSYLFNDVKPGTTIKFKGPDGGFVLPKDLNNEIIMICTGTGVAPFRSMIRYIFDQQLSFNKIHLIFGTRTEDSILYRDEFEQFAADHPNFKYSVALSRENIPELRFGYVHPIYLEAYAEPRSDRQFYICGWTKMIDEAVANLMINLGYSKSQIHYELYG